MPPPSHYRAGALHAILAAANGCCEGSVCTFGMRARTAGSTSSPPLYECLIASDKLMHIVAVPACVLSSHPASRLINVA